MKKKIILLSLCLVLVLSLLAIAVDATFFAPNRVHITNASVTSSQIPQDLDGISIAVLTDLDYGSFMDYDRLSNIVNKVNTIHPDIILFLGDVFDESILPTAAQEEEVKTLLSSLDARLGKFALTGDYDALRCDAVVTLLQDCGFEMIEQTVKRIYNESAAYIYLVGLSQTVTQPQASENLYADLKEDVYTITVSHNADAFATLPTGVTDLFLCGNSHGSQLTIPLYGPYRTTPGNTRYAAGLQYQDGTRIHVSHGLGTTHLDVRLFSDPEILFYRLYAQ